MDKRNDKFPPFKDVISVVHRFDDFVSETREVAVLVLFLAGFLLLSGCSPFSKGGSAGKRTDVQPGHRGHEGHEHHTRQGRGDHRTQNHHHRMASGEPESSGDLPDSEDPSTTGPVKESGTDTKPEDDASSSSTTPGSAGDDTVARKRVEKGKTLYEKNCGSCHGADRRGGFFYPSLVEIGEKYSREELHELIREGRGRMPGFPDLTTKEREVIVSYLISE